ncbi:DNA binding domain-containing protein, excisionase family [Sarcina sp. DSM 11001]|nr:DNA binding domain-containing protein, excisionase family [Sarcina sp. DSM 11001]
MIQDGKTAGMGNNSLTDLNAEGPQRGTFMTVRQMGELLGLKRTEWYWLLHKNLFETRKIYGKTMVNVASFEKWYAGQIHYHKVTGEEPGQLVNATTYSVRDLIGLLGISESRVYALIKREHLKTVSIDFRMRVPREAFDQWYSSQSRYRKTEEKQKENDRLHSGLTIPQMAALLGIPVEDGYRLLEDNEYAHFFTCVILDGQRRIMQEDFEAFLAGQDRFHLVEVVRMAHDSKGPGAVTIELPETADQKTKDTCKRKTRHAWCERTADFITIAEAAEIACVTRQAISKIADRGKIGYMKAGGRILIRRNDFEKWLQDRDAGH